jgi:predicted RNase H-like HicB family nuclease
LSTEGPRAGYGDFDGFESNETAGVCTYTAVVKQEGDWWIGWVEEVTGVNAQETTREGVLASLKVVLQEALEMNRAEARAAAGSSYEELALAL